MPYTDPIVFGLLSVIALLVVGLGGRGGAVRH
jgi:hypothetical protein